MRVRILGVENGILDDRFGSKGSEFREGMPTRSFGFLAEDVPPGTACLAGIFDDPDAVPVGGFIWIHWCFANLREHGMNENASIQGGDFVQGVNSWHGSGDLSRKEATGYGGPAPPDREHEYRFRVFALSAPLELEEGFYLNDLMRGMRGKILAHASAYAVYSPRV